MYLYMNALNGLILYFPNNWYMYLYKVKASFSIDSVD